ncbi:MAG: Gfo/Idh/MocA family oxidoreductase [Planctomycetota bacterium]|nr:Gfo/Idh/MocA family oxidoreductase [Planctomycetota bacterium]
MSKQQQRREFLKISAAASAGFWAAGGTPLKASTSANEVIRWACVGVGGKGTSDSNDAARHGDIVGICDIDEGNLGKASGKWPKAQKFFDYRKMIDKLGDNVDAITVSTPDHNHGPAAVLSLKAGKHTFTQKPLTHTIEEARRLSDLAKEAGVHTQMGNQGTASSNLRRSAALLRSGIVGKVKEVHVWTNRPVWPQGGGRPTDTPEVPAHIHWNEFLGPAKFRPYNPAYTPFKWRGWWDFGTGALGDMACHTLNMPFMGLDLFDPTSVVAETSGHNGETYPSQCKITFEFPEYNGRPAVTLYWYDGGFKPSRALFPKRTQMIDGNGKELAGDNQKYARLLNTGSLIVGDQGSMLSPGDYGHDARTTGIFSNDEYTLQSNIKQEVEYPESPGHFTELANAIKGGPAPVSSFQKYSGRLTETILLGNLAVFADGKKIEWDAKKLVPTNAPEVAHIVRKEYHNGYGI